jgi:hypothetical protein
MKFRFLCSCLLFLWAVTPTSAQTKYTGSGKCAKPAIQQSAPAGDTAGHAYTLAQGKCASKAEIGGVASKEGTFTEHGEVTGNNGKVWGTYVETLANGDKVFYTYESTATMKAGALQSGSNKWSITGGTGKMKGIKGSGTCKLTGTAEGGLDYSCTGEYTLAAAAPAKK